MTTTFSRKISKTHVTFNVCEENLPKKYWDSLIADVSAVVTDNPVHRVLTVNVCDSDFIKEAQRNGDSPDYILNNAMGFTEGKRPTHIHYNPRLYTQESEKLAEYLSTDPHYIPRSGHRDFSQYVVAHEYGHSVTLRELLNSQDVADHVVNTAISDIKSLTTYGRSALDPLGIGFYFMGQPFEAVADAYADYFMTHGKSRNRWTRDAAEILHFPTHSEGE